jgi:hypothetical protein
MKRARVKRMRRLYILSRARCTECGRRMKRVALGGSKLVMVNTLVAQCGVRTLTCILLGVLRLKKHKETSARRMLLRNSTTGKINIVRCTNARPVPLLSLMDYVELRLIFWSFAKPKQKDGHLHWTRQRCCADVQCPRAQ